MEPVYLISNVHRSGSSMMMRCLIAGGLNGVYNTDTENQIFQDDYDPNPNGFYENNVTIDDLIWYENRLTKFPFRELLSLPVGNYKILFLKRNPEEIFKSMLEFTPFTSWGRDMVVLEFYDEIIGHIISELNKRSDVNLTVLNYRDIVADPLESFNKLVFDGWEIDPVISASLVDETLHRFKLESDGK
jgi:hypothetical protein